MEIIDINAFVQTITDALNNTNGKPVYLYVEDWIINDLINECKGNTIICAGGIYNADIIIDYARKNDKKIEIH